MLVAVSTAIPCPDDDDGGGGGGGGIRPDNKVLIRDEGGSVNCMI